MIPNFYDRDEHRIIDTLQHMASQGLLRTNDRGMYEAVTTSVDLSNLYLFTGDAICDTGCLFAFSILFKRFGLVPTICQRCWKVVIRCRTVFELFRVWDLFHTEKISGKAGIDEREFTKGLYVAFAYNYSRAQGQASWTRIVELLHDAIGGHFLSDFMQTVILKRGCTEMEQSVPAGGWRESAAQAAFERKVLSFLEPCQKVAQPDWVIRHKLRRWCSKAYGIGDLSYSALEAVTGPIAIGFQPVTYHQKEWIERNGERNI